MVKNKQIILCGFCSGSGEGMSDGVSCRFCNGKGVDEDETKRQDELAWEKKYDEWKDEQG